MNIQNAGQVQQAKTDTASQLAALQAQIAELHKQNAELAKANKVGNITLKVSQKGAISVYGFGKWPVTLYRSQMEKLLGMTPAIQEFIKANESQLAVKEVKTA